MAKHFLISWSIDVEEENINTPEQAARFIWEKHFKGGDSIANVFEVRDQTTNVLASIDLNEANRPGIGDFVKVAEPDETDLHTHEFEGIVTGMRNGFAQVTDGDGYTFEVEVGKLTIQED